MQGKNVPSFLNQQLRYFFHFINLRGFAWRLFILQI